MELPKNDVSAGDLKSLCESARKFYNGLVTSSMSSDGFDDAVADLWDRKDSVFDQAKRLVDENRGNVRTHYKKELVDFIDEKNVCETWLFMIDQAILSTENGCYENGKIVCPNGFTGMTAEMGQPKLWMLDDLLKMQFPGKGIAYVPQHPHVGYVLEFNFKDQKK